MTSPDPETCFVFMKATAISSSTSAPWWEPTSRWRGSSPTWRHGGRGSSLTRWCRPSSGPSGRLWSASSSTWASSPSSARRCYGNLAPPPSSRTPQPARARSSKGPPPHSKMKTDFLSWGKGYLFVSSQWRCFKFCLFFFFLCSEAEDPTHIYWICARGPETKGWFHGAFWKAVGWRKLSDTTRHTYRWPPRLIRFKCAESRSEFWGFIRSVQQRRRQLHVRSCRLDHRLLNIRPFHLEQNWFSEPCGSIRLYLFYFSDCLPHYEPHNPPPTGEEKKVLLRRWLKDR